MGVFNYKSEKKPGNSFAFVLGITICNYFNTEYAIS